VTSARSSRRLLDLSLALSIVSLLSYLAFSEAVRDFLTIGHRLATRFVP
jgi:hypothetical protein